MKNTGYNKIEDYLLGRMDEAAKKAFEQQIQADTDLNEKVEEMRNALKILEVAGDSESQKEIQEVQDQFFNNKNPKKSNRRIMPWILAALIATLLISYYFISQPANPQQLFAENYETYPANYANRNLTDSLEIQLARASQFYQQKEYRSVLDIIEKIPGSHHDTKLDLMKGICYLELNQSKEALETFGNIIKLNDPVFQYHAIWYSAMIHLKGNNIVEAKKSLQQLVNAENVNGVYKQKEALQLLKKL